MRMCFSFGTGKIDPIAHQGQQWVRLDALAQFLEGDRAKLLAETLDSSFGEKLGTLPDGTHLLPWEQLPMWMLIIPDRSSIGADHVEGHEVWCREAREALRPATMKFLADLGVTPVTISDGGATPELTPEQFSQVVEHERAIRENLHTAMSPEERRGKHVFEIAEVVCCDPRRGGTFVAHVELLAAAVQFLSREGITGSMLGPVWPSYPLVYFAAELLSRREEILKRPGTVAYTMLVRAGLGPKGTEAPRHRLTPAQFAEMVKFENIIAAHLHSGPGPRTEDGGLTLILSEEECNTPEHRAKTAKHVELTADALRFVVSQKLTSKRWGREMVKFPLAGGAYWIWRSRAEHLAEERETFGAAVIRAAGFGGGGAEGLTC